MVFREGKFVEEEKLSRSEVVTKVMCGRDNLIKFIEEGSGGNVRVGMILSGIMEMVKVALVEWEAQRTCSR